MCYFLNVPTFLCCLKTNQWKNTLLQCVWGINFNKTDDSVKTCAHGHLDYIVIYTHTNIHLYRIGL